MVEDAVKLELGHEGLGPGFLVGHYVEFGVVNVLQDAPVAKRDGVNVVEGSRRRLLL